MPLGRMDRIAMRRVRKTGRTGGRHRDRGQDRGLTLIELAIAVFVLAVASVAAMRAADQSRLAIGGETPRLLARVVAQNRAEELRLYGATARLPATVTLGGHTITIESDSAATEAGLVRMTLVARAESGPGAQVVTYLVGGVR